MKQDVELIAAIDRIEKSVHELMATKKIVVIGGGNVGTFLAAAILNGSENYDLTIVESNEKRREEISRLGIGYEIGIDGEAITTTIFPERFRTTNSMIEPADIVFVATKSHQLTSELYNTEIEPFLKENSKVVLVQNGYPTPEILEAIGSKAVIMVVNTGFSLDEEGSKAVTNKSLIDLPYGSLSQAISREELIEEIGAIFLGNPPGLQVRCDENIIEDVMKKAQYACIGAYCAVEAFKSRHPRDQKFTFGNLVSSEREELGSFTSALSARGNSQIETNISAIVQEVEMIAGFPLLSLTELQERRKVNINIENSLVTDARNGRKMESGIVDNLLELARTKDLETPTLSKLSRALEIIESDGWKLDPQNIREVETCYSSRSRF
jgi:ketopantoate reductase